MTPVVPDGCSRGVDFVIIQDGDLAEGAGVVRDAEDCLAGGSVQVEVVIDEVDEDDLVECSILSRIFLSFLCLSLFQEVRQVRLLSVLGLEIVIDHGVPQPVQGFLLSGTQRGFGGEVSVQCEPRSLEVLVEVVHPPGQRRLSPEGISCSFSHSPLAVLRRER